MTSDRPPHRPKAERPGRLSAARDLLHRDQLREVLAVTPQPWLRNSALAGLQSGLAAAIALPLVWLSPWSHLIGFAALGALVALFGRFAPAQSRQAIVAQCAVWQVIAVGVISGAAWLGVAQGMQLVLLSGLSGLFLFVSVTGNFGAPGPLIFIFAAGASLAPDLSGQALIGRIAATGLVAGLAWAICAGSEALRHVSGPTRSLPVEPPRPRHLRLIAALRSTAGAGIAVFLSHAMGAAHPAWAAMGALAVMQGTHLHVSMNRALQRMAGTVVGAALAWIVLAQDPGVWAGIALLVALQIAIEVVIGFNYAFGQVLVTPLALLMTDLAAPHGAGPEIVPERVMDTMLGATVGIAVAVILSTLDDRRALVDRRTKAEAADGAP